MATPAGRVIEVWRYPVKSLGGERLSDAMLSPRGVDGDRRWAVRGTDGKLGSGKTTRRFRRMPGLLTFRSTTGPDGRCSVVFPGGVRLPVDDPRTAARVGDLVGEPVTLTEEGAGGGDGDDGTGGAVSHLDAAPVHLMTTSALAWIADRQPGHTVEQRRFRPNLVVELAGPGRPEDGWVDRRLVVGDAELEVVERTERCVMVTMAQPGLEPARRLLGVLRDEADSCLGVYATVVRPGRVCVGDGVALAD